MSIRILIVGAGAIGGVTAAHLARAGHHVTVLDANAAHASAMRDPGLRFDELGHESLVKIDAVSNVSELTGTFDFALVFLKALYIDTALAPLVERNLVDTYVSFGNGLVQDTVERLVGSDRFLIGVVEWGATNLGVGHVAQTTVAPFVIGEKDGSTSPRTETLAALMADAAEVRVVDNILGQVWAKLLLNSTFSGLGAVSGLTYAEIASDPNGRNVAFRLWAEGFDVSHALGIELDEVAGVSPTALVVRDDADRPAADAALEDLMSKLGPTKASMLQDLERGALTEVDVINGGVTTSARHVCAQAPLNNLIVQIVHGCERGERRPDRSTLAELAGTYNSTS
ncbi:ketopantoate reductase family protein [Rhodococcus fascians]|nr:ketopantoate reductase family protein [Rhodococcus fascians]MBY4235343.1 ketopantoate reductase family protein [Rhodococcus fascians]MBY4251035.1 ketopantoate reductase family protein [Rhodococcus fascians]MBY4266690.1 ketopantoate reductase family protein [Rhodococcus fascians]